MGGGWQHDIIRLNARELFEHGSWGIAEASAALPHLEALPQHEGSFASPPDHEQDASELRQQAEQGEPEHAEIVLVRRDRASGDP